MMVKLQPAVRRNASIVSGNSTRPITERFGLQIEGLIDQRRVAGRKIEPVQQAEDSGRDDRTRGSTSVPFRAAPDRG